MADDANGTSVVGSYELVAELGDTAYGKLYQAQQKEPQRPVRLLVLTTEATVNDAYRARFMWQAKKAAGIKHPNLPEVYDAAIADGIYHLATEWVEGQTVADWLASAGPLPQQTALEIAICCANALNAAWKQAQLPHGDVSLGNILVTADGTVKLEGLALAKLEEGNRLADARALGAALYQMLVGAPLPDTAGQGIPNPQSVRPDLSPHIGRLLEKMVTDNPAQGYAAYEPLVEDLAAITEGREPPNTPLLLGLHVGDAVPRAVAKPAAADASEPAMQVMPVKPQKPRRFDLKLALPPLLALAAVGSIWMWLDSRPKTTRRGRPQYILPASLPTSQMPAPPAAPPAATPAPATTTGAPAQPAPAPAAPPAPAGLSLEAINKMGDVVARGRAMALHLGAAKIQKMFNARTALQPDGRIQLLYDFNNSEEIRDFHAGAGYIEGGALHVRDGSIALRAPFRGNTQIKIVGRMMDHTESHSGLVVNWHVRDGSTRYFGFVSGRMQIVERLEGKTAVLAQHAWAPPLKELCTVVVTQTDQQVTVRVETKAGVAPVIGGTMQGLAEGAMSFSSSNGESAFDQIEVISTVAADWLAIYAR